MLNNLIRWTFLGSIILIAFCAFIALLLVLLNQMPLFLLATIVFLMFAALTGFVVDSKR